MHDIVFEFEQQRIFDKWKNRNMITEQKIEECNDILQLKKWDLELRKLIFKNIDERENDILKTLVRFRIDYLRLHMLNDEVLVSNNHETYINPMDYHKTRYEIKERLYDDIDDFMKNTDPEGYEIGILENSNELVQRKGRFAFIVLSSLKVVEHRKSEAQIDFKMNFDQTDKLLNDVLNKAMCRPTRVKNPNSNTVAQFVIDYMKENALK